MDSEIKNLTGKQKLFADYYLSEAHFNGTAAAALAGYKGNKATLAAVASENLRKPNIKSYIDERLSSLTMPANVVLARLTEIANGKVSDFLNEDKSFNLKKAKEAGKDHLLKKLKFKRSLREKKTEVREDMRSFLAEDELEDIETEIEIIYEEVEFELYSSHEALRDIGKHYKLFTDKTEVSGEITNVQLTVEEWRKAQTARREEAAKTAEMFDENE